MIRFSRSCIIALTVAATAACGSDSIAPRADATSERASLKIITRNRTATSATITVTPSGGTFALGKHSIKFPKRSICALNSSYGTTEWDKPCDPASGPVTFQVQIVSLNGREWLDFTPSVRFVPTTSPKEYVTLFMRTDNLPNDLSEDDLQILWSPAIGIPGIDESIDDPTVRTKINRGAGMLQRRIKHFSGYNVGDGVICESSGGGSGLCPPDNDDAQ